MNEIIKNSAPNSLIFNHNHPSNGSFSEEDLRLINRNISIKTISAIGHNGNKYYIHIPDGKRVSDKELKKKLQRM